MWLLIDAIERLWAAYRRLDWRLQLTIALLVILFFTVNVPTR